MSRVDAIARFDIARGDMLRAWQNVIAANPGNSELIGELTATQVVMARMLVQYMAQSRSGGGPTLVPFSKGAA